MGTGKKPRTFRLSREAEDSISTIAERDGVSATVAVERAVIAYADGREGGTAVVGEPAEGAAVSALAAQLAVKDSQISALTAALASAQESVKASQALNAAALKQLPAQDADDAERPRRGLFSRFRRK